MKRGRSSGKTYITRAKRARDEDSLFGSGEVSAEDLSQVKDLTTNMYESIVSSLKAKTVLKNFPSGHAITPTDIKEFDQKFRKKQENRRIQMAVSDMPLSYVAENRDGTKEINHSYNVKFPENPDASNQLYTGRCWMFAGLNAMRIVLMRHLNLGDKFELSHSHLFFYDKIERANMFLHKMFELRDRDLNDSIVTGLMTECEPTTDGGTWSFFCNLVQKYGLLPMTEYTECYNSSFSDEMNDFLRTKLFEMAKEIRTLKSLKEFQVVQKAFMSEVFNIVSKFMGKPTESFTWEYEDRDHVKHVMKDMTPLRYYMELVEPHFSLDTKMVICHDPREHIETHRYYVTEHFHNMVNGYRNNHVVMPQKTIKNAVIKSLQAGIPVWFDCDVGQCFNYMRNSLDDKGYDLGRAMGVKIGMSKADELAHRLIGPSHAMLLVGVNLVGGKPTRWRIENSWGYDREGEADPGHLVMTDTWFDKYVFDCVVDESFMNAADLALIKKNRGEPIVRPFNDPFGAVAKKCAVCHQNGKRNYIKGKQRRPSFS